MEELARGLWHWSAVHPNIGARVHSYYWEPGGLLIDPMLPREGLRWFGARPRPPRVVALTNRLHLRYSGEFQKAFGVTVFCHRAGLHEFPRAAGVRGFSHGARLPGGALALGDSAVRRGRELAFVPDEYMGEDPEAVKRGLRRAFARLARRPFKTLLPLGAPLVPVGWALGVGGRRSRLDYLFGAGVRACETRVLRLAGPGARGHAAAPRGSFPWLDHDPVFAVVETA